MDQQSYGRTQAIALGFLAGYVDTLGFVALFGLFTAHVTGNFILIGAALAEPSHSPILLKLLAFPAFVVGVAVACVLVVRVGRLGAAALKPGLLLELVLLLGFMGCGVSASPVDDQATPLAMSAGLLGAAARFDKFVWRLIAFACGCVAAAFAYRRFGFAALAIPVLILLGLLALEAPAADGQVRAKASP